MEEIVYLIFHGCKLVKNLEETLVNIANQPHALINSCDEISRLFGNVRDKLSMGLQEFGHHQQNGLEAIVGQEFGGGNLDAVVTTNIAPSSSFQRTRKRKHEADRRTFRTPAPRMGNTDVPPEDGYTWRKYGQKEILGSRFPRGYYRCTHQKLYNCPAKKQVQRLDNDPYIFEVTYRGDHICTMSSTAPSMVPPPPETMDPQTASHSVVPHWLSMDIKHSVGDLYRITEHSVQMYRNQIDIGDGPCPSSPARYVVDYPEVTDLLETMFNSGSSSNNSMELIFSTYEEEELKK